MSELAQELKLISTKNPNSLVTESYRNLRNNISFVSPDKDLASLVIASSEPQAGKSLTTANLAISIAYNHQDVIIIDADLRKPFQHKLFNLSNFEGLSSVLTGKISANNSLQSTNVDRLQLITAGKKPPNPAELLTSQRMEEVITWAQETADWVLIDTAPVMPVTEGIVLASKADGTLLVVNSQRTDQDLVIKSQQKLERAGAKLIGTVLNNHPIEDQQYDGYYSAKL